MLVAIDIGNSAIKIGYFHASVLTVQRMDTSPLRPAEAYLQSMHAFLIQSGVEKKPVNGIISSVVAAHTTVLAEALRGLLSGSRADIITVDYRIKAGLSFRIRKPEALGPDRIANAAAAYDRYHCPVVVIDCGTATTMSVVDYKGNFNGGSIMPGLRLISDMLAQGTSKLQKVCIEPPASALGTDTGHCIRSGMFYGTAGALERIIEEIEKETGEKFEVVLTGGYSTLISSFLKRPHAVDLNLTLKGLKIIYDKNRHT